MAITEVTAWKDNQGIIHATQRLAAEANLASTIKHVLLSGHTGKELQQDNSDAVEGIIKAACQNAAVMEEAFNQYQLAIKPMPRVQSPQLEVPFSSNDIRF